jgi:hypothetical protein
LSPNAFDGIAPCALQMRKIQTAQVAEFDPFELLPDAFVRMQFWGIVLQW